MAAFLAIHSLLGPSITADSYADVEVGALLWSGQVDALGNVLVAKPLPKGAKVYIVVEGIFSYSGTGRQDALYRWHPGKDDAHAPCELDASIGRAYAFVIDDACHLPVASDRGKHTYVYRWRAGKDGTIRFAINDNKTHDNKGHLEIKVFSMEDASRSD